MSASSSASAGQSALTIFCAIASAAYLATAAPEAQKGRVERGRSFAEANCARCHAIGPTGNSSVAKAPPFRTLHNRYPVEDIVEALAEGTAHSQMLQLQLSAVQIDDLIAYLKSLER